MLRRMAFLLLILTLSASAQTKPVPSTGDQQLLDKVDAYLRALFAWDANYKVKIGPLNPSELPDTFEVPVQVTDSKGQSETGTVYVTKDGHYLFRGEIRNLDTDPFAANLAKLRLAGMPSTGPEDAKVTVVEFTDFECPHCRDLFGILKTVEPEFPQVRFVFKDFPLIEIHPWAMTAALGARCTFMSSPAAYWKLQDAIFTNQDSISPDNAWDKITAYGTAAGMSPEPLHACMASPDTKKFIDDEITEGKLLAVESTPTLFINGRQVVSGDKQLLESLIRFELSRAAR
jgi:protein-disulfide isomerase